MEGVPREEKFPGQLIGPAILDKTEIELFLRAVDLVADNRVAKVRQMHSDLVGSTGPGDRANDRKAIPVRARPNESFFHSKCRQCRRASLVDLLLEPDR